MKKCESYGLTPWKIDSPIERFLGKKADTSEFWKARYVDFYRIFDREYYEKGLPRVEKAIDTFRKDCPDREKYVRDMVYSLHRFGSDFEEYFNFEFEKKSPKERGDYVTRRIRTELKSKFNKASAAETLVNKRKTYEVLRKFYQRTVLELPAEKEKFASFYEDHASFFVKLIDSCCGNGAHIYHKEEGKSAEECLRELTQNGTVIVEELIDQDERMAVFHPQSVNTIRCIVIKKDGKPHFLYAYLRSGRKDSIVDCLDGGCAVLIDKDSGKMISKGCDPHNNTVFETHPDTGAQLLGYQIPRWDELKELITEASVCLGDDLRDIGWDVALSKKGWVIVEGNSGGFLSTIQVLLGHGIKRELESYI